MLIGGIGSATRTGFAFDGATGGAGTPSVYGLRQLTAHAFGADRFGASLFNKVYCKLSDYQCDTFQRGIITRDNQGSWHYWRLYADADDPSGGGVTYEVNDLGILAVTRAGGASGKFRHIFQDLGFSLPTL